MRLVIQRVPSDSYSMLKAAMPSHSQDCTAKSSLPDCQVACRACYCYFSLTISPLLLDKENFAVKEIIKHLYLNMKLIFFYKICYTLIYIIFY